MTDYDTIWARWMVKQTSLEENNWLKKQPEYHDFNQLKLLFSYLHLPPYDKEKVWKQIKRRRELIRRKKIAISAMSWAAFAAGLIAMLLLWPTKAAWKTQPGQQLTIQLPDQSNVMLGPSSEISYQNIDSEREVSLQGKAFFEVKQGGSFLVKMNNGIVKVLGTSFQVHQRPGRLEVICYEGEVKLECTLDGSFNFRLKKGEGVRIRKGGEVKKIPLPSEASEPAWLKGELKFYDETLEEILSSIERNFAVEIVGKPQYRQGFRYNIENVSQTDLDLALKKIGRVAQFTYRLQGDQVILTSM